MKVYNLIKNFFISSITSTLYYGYVLEVIPQHIKLLATGCVFVVLMVCLTNMDRHAYRKWREKMRRVRPTMKKSA